MGTRHWPDDADEAVERLEKEVDRLFNENAELRGRCAMLELVERGLTEQNRQLMDPIIRAKMLEPPPPIYMQAGYSSVLAQQINDIIYAAGAPVGSENYFKIRTLCCDILKAARDTTHEMVESCVVCDPDPVGEVRDLVAHYCNVLDNLGDVPIPNFEVWAEDQWKKGSELLQRNGYFRDPLYRKKTT